MWLCLALAGRADRAVERARPGVRRVLERVAEGERVARAWPARPRAPVAEQVVAAARARTRAGSCAWPGRACPPARPRPGRGTPRRRTTRPCPCTSGPPSASRVLLRGRRAASPERAVAGGGQRPAARRRAGRTTRCRRARRCPTCVTTLMAEAADRPCSAEKRLVAIWNSCTASCGRFASGPPDDVVVVVLPVDRDVAAAPELAGGGHGHAVRLRRVEVRRRRVAGHQERELQEVAAVQRQVLDGLAAEITSSTTERRDRDRRGRGYGEGFLARAGQEAQGEIERTPDLGAHVVIGDGRERRRGHRHRVFARRQVGEDVRPRRARRRLAPLSRRAPHRLHACARHRSPAGVGHLAGQRRRGLILRERRRHDKAEPRGSTNNDDASQFQ